MLDINLQRVVPKRFRAGVLHLAHYPSLLDHPGGIRMYYTLREEYYWPHMVNAAYSTVRTSLFIVSRYNRNAVQLREGKSDVLLS